MTVYPADGNVSLIVSDDIRQEIGNKLTIIGYYVGGDILIESAVTVASLAFMFIARGGDGYVEQGIKITLPSGVVMPEAPRTSTKLDPKVPFVQAVRFVGLPLTFGTCTAILSLDAQKYVRSFLIRQNPPAA